MKCSAQAAERPGATASSGMLEVPRLELGPPAVPALLLGGPARLQSALTLPFSIELKAFSKGLRSKGLLQSQIPTCKTWWLSHPADISHIMLTGTAGTTAGTLHKILLLCAVRALSIKFVL